MNVELMHELIDEIPEGDDRLYDLIIHDRKMYSVVVERLTHAQIDDSVKEFAMHINLGK